MRRDLGKHFLFDLGQAKGIRSNLGSLADGIDRRGVQAATLAFTSRVKKEKRTCTYRGNEDFTAVQRIDWCLSDTSRPWLDPLNCVCEMGTAN